MATFDPLSLTNNTIAQLHKSRYAIVDNFLTEDFASQLLRDAEKLFAKNLLKEHYFQFGGSLLKKPNVYELDLSGGDVLNEEVGCWADILRDGPLFVSKMDELDRRAAADLAAAPQPRLLSLDTNSAPAIKLQINIGGGSFPWHYDNPGPPNKRSLTCVVYLNPDWSRGDGGEIVLWPFLEKQVIIPPLYRRAVLFYSDCILHRVLPSNIRRVCFTLWCNGDVNRKDDVVLSKDHLKFTSYDEAQHFFGGPLQRVISRAVYSEEYLESLLECFVVGGKNDVNNQIATEEKAKLVKQHEASVFSIKAKLRPLIEEFCGRKDAIRIISLASGDAKRLDVG